MQDSNSYLYQIFYKNLTSDLVLAKFKKLNNAMAGYCYIVAEVLKDFDKENRFKVMHINHEGISHWFLMSRETPGSVISGEYIDATVRQFKTPVPYEKAKGKGFLTKELSFRALCLKCKIEKALQEIPHFVNMEWSKYNLLSMLATHSKAAALEIYLEDLKRRVNHDKPSDNQSIS